ncbi:MAG: pseudouridine synthase [Desulfobulbus propionicus]|nr:MAG: pseudouridine synthase [Desulfobulbus propionicus]
MERLQKILAQAGITSRRGAERLIASRRVSVNGKIIEQMGCKIDPERDTVTFDGKPVVIDKKIYILLNKPAGYVTTLSDPQGRPIVTDLVADIPVRLFPVGRLDLETEGALLMTNDGEFGNHVLHPRYEVNKTYLATVQGSPSPQNLRRLERGIMLDGHLTSPAHIHVRKQAATKTVVQIVIHEGKKRQVRKMFQEIGHRVLHLQRVAYGGLYLGTLAKGTYRFLTKNDIKRLFSGKIPFTIKNIPA